MPKKEKSLSERVADDIIAMITIDKRFAVGDKLPNENELSSELKVSRTTLREAIRILVAHNIDLSPKIEDLKVGDSVEFYGEYEWNNKGGVIHWTHHDPRKKHKDGWLKHKGKIYQ